MSSRVELVSTEFKNIATGEVTYGYRIYDDHDQAYCNQLESPIFDDLELLAAAIEYADDRTDSMLDYAANHGAYINDCEYTAEQLAPIFLAAQAPNNDG